MRAAALRLRTLLDRAEEAFMALALGFMTLVTFVQVVLRYVFESGFLWHLEATTYTFAWLVLIGMSYCVRTSSHIAVDLVTAKLGAGAARLVGVTALAVSLAYCALMIWGSGVFIARLIDLGNDARDIPVQRWVLTGIMPIAFALLGVRLLEAGWQSFAGAHGTRAPR